MDIDWLALLHDAGRSEPDLRTAYEDGRARADRTRRGVFEAWPKPSFRPGVDATRAADTYAALCNIGVYQILTAERGWTPGQIQDWWRDTLTELLLPT